MKFLRLIRLAARSLMKRPLFSVGAILCLALALGTGSSLLLFIYGILLRPLPVVDPDRLVWISSETPDHNGFGSFSYPDLLDLQKNDPAFSGVAGYVGLGLNLRRGAMPEAVRGQAVTPNYFAVLGVDPPLGRGFLSNGGSASGTEHEVVLGYDLWTSRFGADPGVLGKIVFLDEEPFTVVGVAPKRFKGTQFLSGSGALWIPLRALPAILPGASFEARDQRWLEVMGRLRAGTDLAAARAATEALSRQLESAYPKANEGVRFTLYPTRYGHPNQLGSRISISISLAVTAVLVLLFACTNVTSLLLARTRARMKDLGIQVALGAARGEIISQLMTENLLLFLAAGLAAVVLAVWTGGFLARFQPPGLGPIGLDFSVDGKVVAGILLLALLPGVAFGLIPALQAARVQVVESLRGDTLFTAGAPRRLFNWRNILLMVQVAISVVLLITAGLLLRSLTLTQSIDLGLRHPDVIVVPLDLKPLGYEGARAQVELQNILDRFHSVPQVRAAALVSGPPLNGGWDTQGLYIDGHQPPAGRDTFPIDFTAVSPDYFNTLGIPLLKGRDFSRQDSATGPRVAIINQEMADRFWPGRDVVGQRIRNDRYTFEIVGVVATSKYRRPAEEPRAFVYFPLAQSPSSAASLVIDAEAAPGAAASLVRRELLALDPKIPVTQATTLSQSISALLFPARLGASLLSICGLLTLVLAAVGIYGSVAYSVVSRSREIGIRMALGAQRGQVLGLILRQSLTALWIGAVLGLILSASLSGLLRGFLYGIGPSDLWTYAEVLLFFAAITISAAFFPARRAAAMNPASSLQQTQG